ncbi:Cysteine proteinases superfamily protein [Striga hermonthica]|uniref:ubiquitinyl hydrolase 1 n=1 Tax=Striga hermonthica TaxID=68872 RepID=A0A9N7RL68_STRHE|nr:Cysteine proteinases superfamily protein [Striga hermonthica]
MITYEQDPDVLRWGLQLFEGDPYLNCGYSCSIPQHNTDCYTGRYLKGYQYNMDSNYQLQNDLSADNLHEELSRLSVVEPIKSFQEEAVESQPTPFCPQDWFSQSLGNNTYEIDDANVNENEEVNELGVAGSCSSPGDEMYPEEDWSYLLDLMDEYAFNGEVGKRLNQMVPIPHIPKINGDIPSIDDATLDYQRLRDRLQMYELVEFKVLGDGNCQFRALSDQFYRTPEHHKFVRQQIVKQLRSYPEIYEGYVPMAYDHYLSNMSKNGEWGDHVTLQAAADCYGMKVFVITSFKDTCYIEILPHVQKSERVIFLSFWAEVHYNSIYPQGDCPAARTTNKKKWGQAAAQHEEHMELTDDFD